MRFPAENNDLHASVVICTHNPRSDHLARTLEALRRQTLPSQNWELLIVDNASRAPLTSEWDLGWHPNARHILETKLGLSWARLRGIDETSTDLVIFVDDDNVLAEDYLAQALRIKQEWPSLGVWGSGAIRGEFEVEPPKRVLSWLPVREVATPRWSNLAGSCLFGFSAEDGIPWGAGLCVRKEVAVAYRRSCENSKMQITDRKGSSLVAGGDTEIAFACCSHGLGVGVFPELKLLHLIPQCRVSESYIVRFSEGTCFSNFLLHYKWKGVIPQPTFSARTLLVVLRSAVHPWSFEGRMRLAWVRALAKANKMIGADLAERTAAPSGYSNVHAQTAGGSPAR